MNRNDILILIFGILVLLLVGGTFTAILIAYVRKRNKLVETGQADEEILQEYNKEKRKSTKIFAVITRAFDLLICVAMGSIVVASIVANAQGNQFSFGDAGVAKVVRSPSMASKQEDNKYLFDNDLNNQFDTFDIVFVKELPDEMSLQLYDIVVYEKEGFEIIHRIIEIEEPNVVHPDCRWFTLKGDANKSADVKPVLYSQMTGIYADHKIPFIGIFVLWMQSVLGYLILFAILFYAIGEPIVSHKMKQIRDARIAIILANKKDVNYPGAVPTIKILCNKYYLDSDDNYKNASQILEQYAQLLNLTKVDNLEDNFIYRDVSGNELVTNNLIELYSLNNPNELFHGEGGEFNFAEHTNEQGMYHKENKDIEVTCRHSLASRLLLSKEDIQQRFAEFSKTLCSYGAIEEKQWDRSIYKINDIVLATIELEKDYGNQESDNIVDAVIINDNEEPNLSEMTTSDDAVVNESNESDNGSIIYHGKEYFVSYRRSFVAKLAQANPIIKENYEEIKNYLLSYGLKARMSWGCEAYRKNNKTYCKISIRGTKLCVFLALDPTKYAETKYFYKDVSKLKKYEMVPMLVKVNSNRGAKWTKELIDIIANENNIEVNEKYEFENFAPKYKTTKQLVKENLIKVEKMEKLDFSKYAQNKADSESSDEENEAILDETTPEENSNE